MTTISLQTIHDETLWVAKMCGYRDVGTYAEVGYLFYDEDCRDFDTVCAEGQPESVRPFWEAYEAYASEHGFILVDDFYRNVYAVEALTVDPTLGEYVEHESEYARAQRERAEFDARAEQALDEALYELRKVNGVHCEESLSHGEARLWFAYEEYEPKAEFVDDVMLSHGFALTFIEEHEGDDVVYVGYDPECEVTYTYIR